MSRPFLKVLSVLATSALVAGCGDDSSSESEERESASPAIALREVGETRAALQAALATYKDGDAAAAEEQVAEAYVQHFEEVEGALDERDHELNEELEEAISGELRELIKAKKPVARVQSAFEEVYADLDKAQAALR
jgi:DNA phosphorothioation-dependent restriction protein DptG